MRKTRMSIKDRQEHQSVAAMPRRRFIEWIAATILLAEHRPLMASAENVISEAKGAHTLRVAAIQMVPQLGAVDSNLAQAEQLVRQAAAKDAVLIVLPEMFTSAAAFHEDMIKAIRPLGGGPAQLLKDLARQESVILGGSFLAEDAGRVYNAFLLVMPDGTTSRHDKDFPTYWETCYYEKGHDDGVLSTPFGPMGAALCWEMVRAGTARRLLGRIRLLLAGSTWWTLPDDAGPDHPLPPAECPMSTSSSIAKPLPPSRPRLYRSAGPPHLAAWTLGKPILNQVRGPPICDESAFDTPISIAVRLWPIRFQRRPCQLCVWPKRIQ
jgi:hypothetical protein